MNFQKTTFFYLENFKINKFCFIIISYLFIYYFCAVSLNEASHDAVSHHLTIPSQMYLNHHWPYDVNNFVWAAVQHGSQWIFTFLYFLK